MDSMCKWDVAGPDFRRDLKLSHCLDIYDISSKFGDVTYPSHFVVRSLFQIFAVSFCDNYRLFYMIANIEDTDPKSYSRRQY